MTELLKNEVLTLQYSPGKGAWTYHLVIPGTKEIRGRWGHIKVSGTIDGYKFKNLNLAPLKNSDKRISVNSTIREAIAKGGGDQVVVTMYKITDNRITDESDVKDCFRDADVYKQFRNLKDTEQAEILNDILSQRDEERQEKRIIHYIKKISNVK
jgi:hypothetical protein